MKHVIPISGKDSAATAIVAREMYPDREFEYIFNETGFELPEMAAWLTEMERYLDAPIKKIGADLETVIYEQGVLPSQKMRYCTRLVKIFPMEDALKGEDATLYFGIRADENRLGYQSTAKSNITSVYPLQLMGFGIEQVWKLLEDRELLPPSFFWQRLYDRVVVLLGVNTDWLSNLAKWEIRALFAWRSRSNCSMCFNQRLYEWIGLSEHHPDLFEQAARIESEVGAVDFYFRKGESLRQVVERGDSIVEKRALQIVKMLALRAQQSMFTDAEDGEIDILSITSCGLLCGK